MLFRFSLYGFLKNQQYFEPFLILVFLEKGLDFFQIGLLIACRELTVNLFEILSGALADVWGRRRAMILSFCAYIASFVLFALAPGLPLLFLAMFLFGIGHSLRTGTHKAMIFTWLRLQNRTGQRTRVYGLTRSWSKMGSAVSVVLAAVFVLVSDRYVTIFWLAIVPYALGIVNFLFYPRELDGAGGGRLSLRAVLRHLKDALVATWSSPGLRRLVAESMGFEGMFRVAKDYLQPVLQAAALAAGAGLCWTQGLGEKQKTALLVGPVFFVLFVLSAVASRKAHRLQERAGGEERAAGLIWGVCLAGYAGLVLLMVFEVHAGMILVFVLLYVLQNLWRPILVGRFDSWCDESQGATVLSIESQSKTLVAMLLAPLLGAAVDLVREHDLGGSFWPVGVTGTVIALVFFLLSRRERRALQECRKTPGGI